MSNVNEDVKKDDEYEYVTHRKGGRPRLGKEARSKKVALLLTPSLYARLKETAYRERRSVNEFIFNLIEENTLPIEEVPQDE